MKWANVEPYEKLYFLQPSIHPYIPSPSHLVLAWPSTFLFFLPGMPVTSNLSRMLTRYDHPDKNVKA